MISWPAKCQYINHITYQWLVIWLQQNISDQNAVKFHLKLYSMIAYSCPSDPIRYKSRITIGLITTKFKINLIMISQWTIPTSPISILDKILFSKISQSMTTTANVIYLAINVNHARYIWHIILRCLMNLWNWKRQLGCADKSQIIGHWYIGMVGNIMD